MLDTEPVGIASEVQLWYSYTHEPHHQLQPIRRRHRRRPGLPAGALGRPGDPGRHGRGPHQSGGVLADPPLTSQAKCPGTVVVSGALSRLGLDTRDPHW